MSAAYANGAADSFIWRLPGFVVLLLGYVVLHASLRLWLSPALGVDDVEQAIMAQSWAWGYNIKQPPLYTWLLFGLYGIIGPSLAAHVVLKYLLLFGTFLFLYLAARRILADPRLAALSAWSLLLVTPVGYGAHQGYTHTLLLCAVMALAVYLLLRWRDRATLGGYLGLGLVAGIGMLSKYNFVLFLGGWLLAAALDTRLRTRMLQPVIGVSVAAAALVLAPHVTWLLRHQRWDNLFEQVSAAGVAQSADVVTAGMGLLSVAESSVLFLSPLWLVLALCFPQAWRPRIRAAAAGFIGNSVLCALLLSVFAVLVLALPEFKQRWLHPVLLLAPLYFFARIEAAGSGAGHVRAYTWTLVVAAVLVVLLRGAETLVAPALDKPTRLHMPFPELARQIAERGFERGTVIAGDEHIGGNFRLAFPRARVLSLNYDLYLPPSDVDGQCLVVWNADRKAAYDALALLAAGRLGAGLPGRAATRSIEAPVRFTDGARRLRLHYILLPDGAGECR